MQNLAPAAGAVQDMDSTGRRHVSSLGVWRGLQRAHSPFQPTQQGLRLEECVTGTRAAAPTIPFMSCAACLYSLTQAVLVLLLAVVAVCPHAAG
jgi:hypothetical protein